MRIVDGRVRTEQYLDGSVTTAKLPDGVLSADATGRAKMADGFITKAKNAAEVVENLELSAQVPASDTFKWVADGVYTIIHVTFHNIGGVAYTVAGSITNGGLAVVSSSATLAADAVEEHEGAALSNTAVADGNEIDIIAGDQISFITVTMTKQVNT